MALAEYMDEMVGKGAEGESGDVEDGDPFEALADAFGMPPEKRAAARAALKEFVMRCMMEGDDSEDELGPMAAPAGL